MSKLWYAIGLVTLVVAGCGPANLPTEPAVTPTEVVAPTDGAPTGEAVDAILTLQYQERLTGCQQVLITADTLSSGACDASPEALPLASEFVTTNLEYFQQTYASFDAETTGGHLTFVGQGEAEATPADQRLIAEWARVSAEILQNGNDREAAVQLSVHREGGLAGICEDIVIYASGEVTITSCKGSGATLANGRLQPPQVEQLFGWVDTYTSVEADLNENVAADGFANHLVFVGRSDVSPGQAEQEAMLTFANEVYAQQTGLGTQSGCPGAAVDREVFIDQEAGYCLLYPTGFTVTQPEAGVVVISGPNYSTGPEPLSGFVNITVSDAEGRTAAEISDELVEPFLPDLMIERVEAPLGGERAVEMIGMPGQALSWQVIAVREGKAYLLVFVPLGEEYGQASQDRDALYQAIMSSFTFLQSP